ncbi:MAG: PucR family transcriptional regulator [Clostridia bacterium]|nr:PucR family transcriptional regulator [Clostridia bacterium]
MEFTVSDFLALSEVEGMRLVAGRGGVANVITRTNIMDNPDTFDWLMPGEFLLSTGYIFKGNEALQRQIVRSLAEIGCAGLCIKTKRYLPEIPACMEEEADRLRFPLIELPFGYALSTTIGIINRKLFHQSDVLLEETLGIHREITRTALASGGMHGITETLVRLIGNPVLVTDSIWNLLCYVDLPENPFPLPTHVNTARKQPPFPESFTSSLPNDLCNYKKSIARIFQAEEGDGITCRILPIAAHDYIYGYFIVWESVRKLTDLDYIALEQAAVVAALERIRAKEVEQIKLRVRKDFFDDLLSGNIESLNAIRSLAELHGLTFEKKYRCLLVRYGEDDQQFREGQLMNQNKYRQEAERCAAAIAQAAEEAGLKVVSVPRGAQVAMLVELGRDDDNAKVRLLAQRILDALRAPPALEHVLIVAGKAVANLGEADKSFRTAQHGVRMSRSAGLHDTTVFMDDFAVYQLLSENVDKEALRRFSEGSVGLLVRHDRENGTQFVETLNKYFQYGGNISDAARDMYIHRNTYIYRIEKIKALLDTDLKNPQKLLELQLGLLAQRLLAD